jgi:hypothetical protein
MEKKPSTKAVIWGMGAAILLLAFACSDGEAEKKKEMAAQRANELACNDDLRCFGEKHISTASAYCKEPIERLAKYNVKWTSVFTMAKYKWLDKDKRTLSYFGDSAQFQNGFGAYMNYFYRCDFDPSTKTVLGVVAMEGRLPQ